MGPVVDSLAQLRRLLEEAQRSATSLDPAALLGPLSDVEADVVRLRDEISGAPGSDMDRFVDALVALAGLDFDHTLEVTGEDERLDAFAIGINALAEELQSSTVSLDYVRAIIDSMPDSLVVIDRAGTVCLVNAATSRLTGRPLDSLVGEHVSTVGGPAEAELEALLEGLDLGATHEEDTRYIDAEGRTIPVHLSLRHLEQEGKSVQRYVWVATDITARQQLEAELRQARDVAIASSVARSDFLANMSHEIRTPMNAVIGMTGLLLETELNDQQRSFTEIVRSSGETLLALINDVLDFSKIEAGNLQVESIPTSIRDCVDGAFNVVSVLASEEGLELTHWVEADVPVAIFSDPTRLQQVLVNLLSNAVKFTERGGVAVKVRVASREADELVVEFSVTDTGIGIPSGAIDTLFDAFTQAEASTTRRFGGTGLGLAICKRLTEAMGGDIRVESEVGVGSTFRFTIRGGLARDTRPNYLVAEVSPLTGRRVLVVDDSATNLEILRYWLTLWGMEPETASSGEEALRLVDMAPQAYDFAILDMNMPQMDGIALAQALRGRSMGAAMPLVMLTSLSHPRGRPPPSLATSTLTKPVKPSDLFDCLSMLLLAGDAAGTQARRRHHGVEELVLPEQVRILLAEDNSNNQMVAKLSLGRLGLRVDIVADGVEALQSVRRAPYDVVLMDVHMPRMDGLEASRRIREDSSIAQPYIIAMTASATVQDRDVCVAAGMDDFISKPYRIQDLRRVLGRYEEARRSGGVVSSTRRPGADQLDESGPESGLLAAHVDIAAIDELRLLVDGAPAELASFVDELLPGFVEVVDRVDGASERGDRDTLKLGAHTLKSVAGTLGARSVAELARDLEVGAFEHAEDELRARGRALREAFLLYCAGLADLRASEGW